MVAERASINDGKVVGVGDVHIRHVRCILQKKGFSKVDAQVPNHIVEQTFDAQSTVPGLHIQLALAFHEVIRLRTVVEPDPGGSVFIEPAERVPTNRPHPRGQVIRIMLVLNPHDIGIGTETMQFFHDETRVVIITPAAVRAGDNLVFLHREDPEQEEQEHDQPRTERAGDRADQVPNLLLNIHLLFFQFPICCPNVVRHPFLRRW